MKFLVQHNLLPYLHLIIVAVILALLVIKKLLDMIVDEKKELCLRNKYKCQKKMSMVTRFEEDKKMQETFLQMMQEHKEQIVQTVNNPKLFLKETEILPAQKMEENLPPEQLNRFKAQFNAKFLAVMKKHKKQIEAEIVRRIKHEKQKSGADKLPREIIKKIVTEVKKLFVMEFYKNIFDNKSSRGAHGKFINQGNSSRVSVVRKAFLKDYDIMLEAEKQTRFLENLAKVKQNKEQPHNIKSLIYNKKVQKVENLRNDYELDRWRIMRVQEGFFDEGGVPEEVRLKAMQEQSRQRE